MVFRYPKPEVKLPNRRELLYFAHPEVLNNPNFRRLMLDIFWRVAQEIPCVYDVADSSNQAVEDLNGKRYESQRYDLLVAQGLVHQGNSLGYYYNSDGNNLYHVLATAKSINVPALAIVDSRSVKLEQELKEHNATEVLMAGNPDDVQKTIVRMLKAA